MDKQEMIRAMEAALGRRDNVEPVNMFGGTVWKLNGNMLCGVGKDHFMFRVGKEQEAAALERPGADIVSFSGRRMGGIVWVEPDAAMEAGLEDWIEMAERFVGAQPPK